MSMLFNGNFSQSPLPMLLESKQLNINEKKKLGQRIDETLALVNYDQEEHVEWVYDIVAERDEEFIDRKYSSADQNCLQMSAQAFRLASSHFCTFCSLFQDPFPSGPECALLRWPIVALPVVEKNKTIIFDFSMSMSNATK